jgi:hypothetical protein
MFTKAGNHEGARTRQAAVTNGLVVPYARTDIRKYSFASRTVERWNSLPDGARAAESKQAFKVLLKTTKMYVSEATRNWQGNRETGIDSFCKMTSGKPKKEPEMGQ